MAKENITIKINDKEVYPQSKVTFCTSETYHLPTFTPLLSKCSVLKR